MQSDSRILQGLQDYSQDNDEPVDCRTELLVWLDALQSQLVEQLHHLRAEKRFQPLGSNRHQSLVQLFRTVAVGLFSQPHHLQREIPEHVFDDHHS